MSMTHFPAPRYARRWIGLWLGLLLTLLLALLPTAALRAAAPVPVLTERAPLARAAQPCTGSFVPHTLDHLTTTADGVIRMFEANGTGTAVGDLDGDGDLDMVLGAWVGPDTILWNEGQGDAGGVIWRKQPLPGGMTRAITLPDVDGDGRPDIVLTRRTGALNFFHNQGDGLFTLAELPGVAFPASALGWADLDRDGDLDLVTATYDAGLLTDLGNDYLLNGQGGVIVYTNESTADGGLRFRPTRLTAGAQANALLLHDLDRDGWVDIWVGNDFAEPDWVWTHAADGWTPTQPFSATTHSTMSLAAGDLANRGAPSFLATDMLPYADDPATQAAWDPVMAEMMAHPHPPGDIQVMANTLQQPAAPGRYADRAGDVGVTATGWSWSAQFGDLDNDGYLDLYVVNGMAEERMFAHLPKHELVEVNQARRNDGTGRLLPAPSWGLGSIAGGRSMVMADFDHDGDLDIVVNNLRSPAQLLENRLCGGSSLLVDLRWNGAGNTHGVGATLRLRTSLGTLTRTLHAASGYLSADAPRAHFGLPADADVGRLEITWPDGAVSTVGDLHAGQHIVVTR